jgi:hypothetical protein
MTRVAISHLQCDATFLNLYDSSVPMHLVSNARTHVNDVACVFFLSYWNRLHEAYEFFMGNNIDSLLITSCLRSPLHSAICLSKHNDIFTNAKILGCIT